VGIAKAWVDQQKAQIAGEPAENKAVAEEKPQSKRAKPAPVEV
jgi:hypothetical protein